MRKRSLKQKIPIGMKKSRARSAYIVVIAMVARMLEARNSTMTRIPEYSKYLIFCLLL